MTDELILRMHELEADVEIYDNECDRVELAVLETAQSFKEFGEALGNCSTIINNLANCFNPVVQMRKEEQE